MRSQSAPPRILGVVVSDPVRASGMSLHGETLAARAVAAFAGWADSVLVGPGGLDPALPLGELCAGADLIVVHDPMCPLLPPAALADCAAALSLGSAVVGVRPVTDTVKSVDDGWLRGTLDRERLAMLASPVVWGADLVRLSRLLPTAGDLADLPGLVTALAGLCTLHGVEVPSAGRRVSDADDLALLVATAKGG